ncbi:hypothetical protein BDZ45DRAFT_720813 [Acephala macrosclerotiorum]|nr:hypothetical protein BDZ45DRAFT_720813 [Acephala macrosclerotiorum]
MLLDSIGGLVSTLFLCLVFSLPYDAVAAEISQLKASRIYPFSHSYVGSSQPILLVTTRTRLSNLHTRGIKESLHHRVESNDHSLQTTTYTRPHNLLMNSTNVSLHLLHICVACRNPHFLGTRTSPRAKRYTLSAFSQATLSRCPITLPENAGLVWQDLKARDDTDLRLFCPQQGRSKAIRAWDTSNNQAPRTNDLASFSINSNPSSLCQTQPRTFTPTEKEKGSSQRVVGRKKDHNGYQGISSRSPSSQQ